MLESVLVDEEQVQATIVNRVPRIGSRERVVAACEFLQDIQRFPQRPVTDTITAQHASRVQVDISQGLS
ncbi:hypothetical protein D7I44_16580 [Gryllotalpicola protaetiae]|uniref:Uncharacterized protein n=1 Tax=Gryllotalpicola protaetiae TaxID=2419771 RepID=A0A387BV51_9MICO|nr:hypothetical protein D7I44_16580 [Gryllotalpicola protaetiae]